jgi:hypothetical protein
MRLQPELSDDLVGGHPPSLPCCGVGGNLQDMDVKCRAIALACAALPRV